MALKSITGECRNNPVAGLSVELYYACTCELNSFPKTKADLGSTDAGDTKNIGEAFDFKPEGFWRKANLLVDEQAFDETLIGENGGKGYESMITGFLTGTEAERLEWADELVDKSGCLIFMIQQRSGNMRVLGNMLTPAFIDTSTITIPKKIGDGKVGNLFTAKANTGKTAPIYDFEAFGLKTEPTP